MVMPDGVPGATPPDTRPGQPQTIASPITITPLKREEPFA